MAITAGRRRTRFKMIVRSVETQGDVHTVTCTAVKATETDREQGELDLGPEGYQTFEAYAAKTGRAEFVCETTESNRWVVGEIFYHDMKPTH